MLVFQAGGLLAWWLSSLPALPERKHAVIPQGLEQHVDLQHNNHWHCRRQCPLSWLNELDWLILKYLMYYCCRQCWSWLKNFFYKLHKPNLCTYLFLTMRTNSVSKEIQNDKEIKVYKYTTKVKHNPRQGQVGIPGGWITSLGALITTSFSWAQTRSVPRFSSLGTTRWFTT